jgi:hypothetical protein
MTRKVYPLVKKLLPGRSDSSSRFRSWAIFLAVLASGVDGPGRGELKEDGDGDLLDPLDQVVPCAHPAEGLGCGQVGADLDERHQIVGIRQGRPVGRQAVPRPLVLRAEPDCAEARSRRELEIHRPETLVQPHFPRQRVGGPVSQERHLVVEPRPPRRVLVADGDVIGELAILWGTPAEPIAVRLHEIPPETARPVIGCGHT